MSTNKLEGAVSDMHEVKYNSVTISSKHECTMSIQVC